MQITIVTNTDGKQIEQLFVKT